MKSSPASFVVSLIVISLLGIGGYAAFRKAQSAPEEIRLSKGFFGALFYRDHNETPVSESDRKRMEIRHEELKRNLLAEYPILRINQRLVPNEENGFLQIHQLGKDAEFRQWEPGLLEKLSDCMHIWDSDKARAVLTKYPAFIEKAKRIASLPSRSSTLLREDYNGFFEARSAKALHDVFLLQARLEAETGNESSALEATRNAMQIRNHIHDVEAPSFLTETVVTLLDLSRMEWVTDVILPKLGSKVDLGAWMEMMVGEAHVPARLAMVSRGEWHTSADYMFLPQILMDHHNGKLEDPDETARVWSARTAWRVAGLENKPAVGFRDLNRSDGKPDSDSLSKEGRAIIDDIDSGMLPWNKSILRAAVIVAQRRAMMDLLIHERDRRAIPELLDPVSGLPFRFDPFKRMLHAPKWEGAPGDVPPLKLPW
jgi:hypothetical protein